MSNFSGLLQHPQQQQQQQQPDLSNSYWGNLAQFGLFPNGRGGVAPASGLGQVLNQAKVGVRIRLVSSCKA